MWEVLISKCIRMRRHVCSHIFDGKRQWKFTARRLFCAWRRAKHYITSRAIANLKFSATFTYLMEELGKIQTPSR